MSIKKVWKNNVGKRGQAGACRQPSSEGESELYSTAGCLNDGIVLARGLVRLNVCDRQYRSRHAVAGGPVRGLNVGGLKLAVVPLASRLSIVSCLCALAALRDYSLIATSVTTLFCFEIVVIDLLLPTLDRYNNLSSVIGKSRMRLPVALNTALATAAATPVIPISPTPCAPIGVNGSGISRKWISMFGTSRFTGR